MKQIFQKDKVRAILGAVSSLPPEYIDLIDNVVVILCFDGELCLNLLWSKANLSSCLRSVFIRFRKYEGCYRCRQQLITYIKGFAAKLEAENRRLNKAKETLRAQKAKLEAQIAASQDAVINLPKLKGFIERMQDRISEVDFEGKRLALEMLSITVWLDGENVEITGTIDLGIVLTPLFAGYSPLKHH